MICDICGRDRSGLPLSNQKFRDAVFSKGFDPFSLGLVSQKIQSQWSDNSRWGSTNPLVNWKKNLVSINQADWFVCSKCRVKLSPYLESTSQSHFRESALEKEWYDEQTAIILSVLFCFPVGLYLLWRTRTYSRRAKIIILIVYAAIMTVVGYINYLVGDTK